MKTALLSIIVVFSTLISCKDYPKNTTEIPPVDENMTDELTTNEPDPMCAEIPDMVASFTLPQKIGEFHLYETVCHPNRTFGYHYESDDEAKDMEFTILIRDTRTPDNADFIAHVNDGFAAAQVSKSPMSRVSKLPYGTKGFVVAINMEGSYGGSYDVFIKENYYLHFLMVNNKSVATTDAIENFVAPLVAKINTAKLK